VIGLPTLASLDHLSSTRMWLATQPADMRCGFDRLTSRKIPSPYLLGHFAEILGEFQKLVDTPDLNPRQACSDQTAAINSKTFLKISDYPIMSCILKD
jgi:hypothetical protein